MGYERRNKLNVKIAGYNTRKHLIKENATLKTLRTHITHIAVKEFPYKKGKNRTF